VPHKAQVSKRGHSPPNSVDMRFIVDCEIAIRLTFRLTCSYSCMNIVKFSRLLVDCFIAYFVGCLFRWLVILLVGYFVG